MRTPLLAVLLLLPALTWAENLFELIGRDGDWELIQEAARELTPERVQALLDAGAALEARDGFGNTPLMEAARNNANPEVLQALIDAGADATARNDDGDSAWDLIKDNEALQGTDVYQRLNELSAE